MKIHIQTWALLGFAIATKNLRLLAYLLDPFPLKMPADDDSEDSGTKEYKTGLNGQRKCYADLSPVLVKAAKFLDATPRQGGINAQRQWEMDLEYILAMENTPLRLPIAKKQATPTSSPSSEAYSQPIPQPLPPLSDFTLKNIETNPNAINYLGPLTVDRFREEKMRIVEQRGQQLSREANLPWFQEKEKIRLLFLASLLFSLSPPHRAILLKNPGPWILPLVRSHPELNCKALIEWEIHTKVPQFLSELSRLDPLHQALFCEAIIISMIDDPLSEKSQKSFDVMGGWGNCILKVVNAKAIWFKIIERDSLAMYNFLHHSPQSQLPNVKSSPLLTFIDQNPYAIIDHVLEQWKDWISPFERANPLQSEVLSKVQEENLRLQAQTTMTVTSPNTADTTNTNTTTTTTTKLIPPAQLPTQQQSFYPVSKLAKTILTRPLVYYSILSPCKRSGTSYHHRGPSNIEYENLAEAYLYNCSPLIWPLSQLLPETFPEEINWKKWLAPRFMKCSSPGEYTFIHGLSLLPSVRALFTLMRRYQIQMLSPLKTHGGQNIPEIEIKLNSPVSCCAAFESGWPRQFFLQEELMSKVSATLPLLFQLLAAGWADFDMVVSYLTNYCDVDGFIPDGLTAPHVTAPLTKPIEKNPVNPSPTTSESVSKPQQPKLFNLGTVLDTSGFGTYLRTDHIPGPFDPPLPSKFALLHLLVLRCEDNPYEHRDQNISFSSLEFFIEYHITSILNGTDEITFNSHSYLPEMNELHVELAPLEAIVWYSPADVVREEDRLHALSSAHLW